MTDVPQIGFAPSRWREIVRLAAIDYSFNKKEPFTKGKLDEICSEFEIYGAPNMHGMELKSATDFLEDYLTPIFHKQVKRTKS